MSQLGWYPLRVSTRRSPSDAEVDRLEARLGGALPDDYRQFIRRYGQGAVRHGKWFPLQEPTPWGQWGIVDQFLGYSTKATDGLDAALDLFEDRIPAGTLPIAYDPGGNLLLLSASGAAAPPGAVWFWDHEHRPRPSSDGDDWRATPGQAGPADDVYAVAPSFTTFLESLRAGRGQ
jgi:hypothetical protein